MSNMKKISLIIILIMSSAYGFEADKMKASEIPLGSSFTFIRPKLSNDCNSSDHFILSGKGNLRCEENPFVTMCSFRYPPRFGANHLIHCKLKESKAEGPFIDFEFVEYGCPTITCAKGFFNFSNFDVADIKTLFGKYAEFTYQSIENSSQINNSGRGNYKESRPKQTSETHTPFNILAK